MSTSTDPVLGMKVDSESGRSMEHAGERYKFCSQCCAYGRLHDLLGGADAAGDSGDLRAGQAARTGKYEIA